MENLEWLGDIFNTIVLITGVLGLVTAWRFKKADNSKLSKIMTGMFLSLGAVYCFFGGLGLMHLDSLPENIKVGLFLIGWIPSVVLSYYIWILYKYMS